MCFAITAPCGNTIDRFRLELQVLPCLGMGTLRKAMTTAFPKVPKSFANSPNRRVYLWFIVAVRETIVNCHQLVLVAEDRAAGVR